MNGEQMDNVGRIVSALNACERIGWGAIEIGGSLAIAAEGRIERHSDRMRGDQWQFVALESHTPVAEGEQQ